MSNRFFHSLINNLKSVAGELPARVVSVFLLIASLSLVMLPVPTPVQERTDHLGYSADGNVSHRYIVKSGEKGSLEYLSLQLANFDLNMRRIRTMSGGADVVEISGKTNRADMEKVLSGLVRDRVMEYAERDAVVTPTAMPDDRLFEVQWNLDATNTSIASLDLVSAWDLTHGSAEVVVAVIDTGVRFEHEDLTGRLLPGYDFVSGINARRARNLVPDSLNFIKAHDGDGRDADATDPGDGVDRELHELMESYDIDCPMQESSWHGTAMASLIAANGDDGIGMTGVDWHAKILPVRAIGRCGGRRSDLLDAIRWAAGVADPALAPNPTPARIINLSLGIDDACTVGDQRAINDAVAAGAMVVSAVGNLGRDLNTLPSSPSHCNNVLGVTAVNSSGLRASYSSFGRDADLAAPGGEGASGDNRPIIVATNDGYIEPEEGSSHRYTTGTSVASPLVSGIIALMLSTNPDLTNSEITALLKATVRPFPFSDDSMACDTATCGAGLVDAFSAVKAAAGFNPEEPGLLAAAILADEAVVTTGGSATVGPLALIALGVLVNLYGICTARRRRKCRPNLRRNLR